MEFGTCQNEIKQYLDARFVSAHEAAWHLFMFNMHCEWPNVVRLQVHLPNHQPITWNTNISRNLQDILRRAQGKNTTLTAAFKANTNIPEARTLLYQEFPQQLTWSKSARKWTTRQRGFAIGRMNFVSPKAGEQFYL